MDVTDKDFEVKVLKSEIPVLVDFWAPWCAPCRAIAPAVEEIKKKYQGKLKVLKMNVDENSEIPSRLHIFSIPTLIVFKDGKEVSRVIGAVPIFEIEKFVKDALNPD